MEETFLAMLDAQTSFIALVGGAGMGARVYPLVLPQKPTFPAMTYQVISAPRDYTQDGADGVVTYRIQCNCYGADYAEAKSLRDALVGGPEVPNVTGGVSGLFNAAFGSPPQIVQGCFVDNERDIYEESLAVLPEGIPYRKSIDLKITFGRLGSP